ncbi:MAG: ATP-binding cassette domain-containing protein [Actinobacteria bacterium]|nr:ATP-binding cassette domain-containing protein [Actinomycetota bacterium]
MHELTVSYGSTVALPHPVSLSVAAGEVVALDGEPRSGKTTVLRAVSGLLALHQGRVTGGSVTLDGQPLAVEPAAAIVRLGVAHVLQGRRLFRDLSVEDNLRAGGFTLANRASVQAGVERVLARFPLLGGRRSTLAGYLSGGEQQLLAIGRALVASPRLLLLDEPSLGLAAVAVEQLAGVVAEVAGDGTGVLMAEGTAALARATGARPVVLERGTVVTP